MKLEPVTCNNCGASLKVPVDANFVTCLQCDSQLKVNRSEGARFTEVLAELNEKLDALNLQSDLERLDRDWEQEKESYMVTGKNGHKSLPNKTGSVIGGIVITVFGLFWTVIAFGIGSSAASFGPGSMGTVAMIFPLFGLVFIAFGIYAAATAYQKAEKYERGYRKYQKRKRDLSKNRR